MRMFYLWQFMSSYQPYYLHDSNKVRTFVEGYDDQNNEKDYTNPIRHAVDTCRYIWAAATAAHNVVCRRSYAASSTD